MMLIMKGGFQYVLITKKNDRIYVHVPKKYIQQGYLENCTLKTKLKYGHYVYKFHQLLEYIGCKSVNVCELEYLDSECDDSLVIYIETGDCYEECHYVVKSKKHPREYNLCDHLKRNSFYHSQNKYKCKF